MANMTEILKEYTAKLDEEEHILLSFFAVIHHFNNFFEDKTEYLPTGIILFLENLTIFLEKATFSAKEKLVLDSDILVADEKTLILLRDIALFVEKIQKLTKKIRKLNNESDIFIEEVQILMKTHLTIKANAERSQN